MKYKLFRSPGNLDKAVRRHELVAVETGKNIELSLIHIFCRCGLYGKVFAVCGVDDAAHNHFQTCLLYTSSGKAASSASRAESSSMANYSSQLPRLTSCGPRATLRIVPLSVS